MAIRPIGGVNFCSNCALRMGINQMVLRPNSPSAVDGEESQPVDDQSIDLRNDFAGACFTSEGEDYQGSQTHSQRGNGIHEPALSPGIGWTNYLSGSCDKPEALYQDRGFPTYQVVEFAWNRLSLNCHTRSSSCEKVVVQTARDKDRNTDTDMRMVDRGQERCFVFRFDSHDWQSSQRS
jgi:hypothetical protein